MISYIGMSPTPGNALTARQPLRIRRGTAAPAGRFDLEKRNIQRQSALKFACLTPETRSPWRARFRRT
jgi:hypothetical protein